MKAVSLWYDRICFQNDLASLKEALVRSGEVKLIVAPRLRDDLEDLNAMLLQCAQCIETYDVMLPIPLQEAKDYLYKHDNKAYDALHMLIENAHTIYACNRFSWIEKGAYFTDETSFAYQRYRCAKEISRIDDAMWLWKGKSCQQAMGNVADICRMRQREHGSKPWVLLGSNIEKTSIKKHACKTEHIVGLQ